MKIEKIRNNHKKEIIIGTILTVVIGGALTFRLTLSKYRVTQSIDLATGVINYTAPDFKIMAIYISDDGTNYTEITNRMPSGGYVINENKSYCTLDNVNHDIEAKLYTNENGEHIFANLKKSDKCYLYFDKQKLGADQIIANLGTSIKTAAPTFSNIATTDEGVYSTSDGTNMYSGTTYYWRGAATTNYVKFAGFCWRIIKINGDKTLRLIYDGSICHANGTSTTDNLIQPTSGTTNYAYNPTYNASYYVGWTQNGSQRTTSGTNSNAKTQIESWYNSHIENNATYAKKVADGKYCNDRNVKSGQSWVSTGAAFQYATYERLVDNKIPTFNCPTGDVYTLKVGLITADEVAFAGGIFGKNNASYYLNNSHGYWTMSPCWWNPAFMFFVNLDGNLNTTGADGTVGLRPVINLKSDVTFSSGDGTQNNPYTVS